MEKKSKLVLAVLQGSDSDNTIRNLNERGFMVTVLSSTGGFLKKKSTTVMIGVEEDRLEEALDVTTFQAHLCYFYSTSTCPVFIFRLLPFLSCRMHQACRQKAHIDPRQKKHKPNHQSHGFFLLLCFS